MSFIATLKYKYMENISYNDPNKKQLFKRVLPSVTNRYYAVYKK
jgi:hypothetical protein